MSAPRLAAIPFEHVEAELAAFPLASESSFRLSISSLNPLISRDDKLWRDAERYILNALPSVPPDEAVTIRDKLWFNASHPDQVSFDPISLAKYLRRLAESYIDLQGRPIEEAVSQIDIPDRVGPEGRLRWSWVCRALPPDLLRVARGVVDADADSFSIHPAINQMLRDRGFAETHLHLGASPDFSLCWAALMQGLIKDRNEHSEFESFGAYFRHGRDLGTWLFYAAVVRLVLAAWLFERSSSNSSSSLSDLVEFARDRRGSELDIIEHNRLAILLAELKQGRWSESQRSQFRQTEKENLAKRFARTRALYRRLIGPPDLLRDRQIERQSLHRLHKPESRYDIYASDPIARIVGWHPTEAVSPETIFVGAALRYIEQEERSSDFTSLFWQVVRIRCLLYRHIIQRPLTPGLQWFVRFFARIKPLRKNIPKFVLATTAARISGKEVGLRSLEVRLGTSESVSECLEDIRALEQSLQANDKKPNFKFFQPDSCGPIKDDKDKEAATYEIGALFHFSRKRGGGWERGSLNAYGLDHSYPGIGRQGLKPISGAGNPTGFRFARFYLEQRRQAQALVSVFQKYPYTLRTVRGVDLCTDEAGVPVWVMSPLVRWVREAGQQAVTQLRRRGEFAIPPLRASIHAGEDFVHLLTGLRRLDDTVNYLRLEEGDRLGHALALGVDPSAWCNRVGRVMLPTEDRLFDLVWEWSCYAKQGVGVASERLAYVRTEIVRLAHFIFGQSYPPESLMNFVDLLHDERELHALGFPYRLTLQAIDFGEQENKKKDELAYDGKQLLKSYLRDVNVWRKGRVPETVDLRNIKHEQAALNQLQSGLRHKVGQLCLTVEVNPSSNLLVGDLGNFTGHPLWRLRPLTPVDDISPLSVCIGSDDPLVFATTLPHEYQLLFDTLILMGHSQEVAMRWIDAARDAGMQSRFTLPPPDKAQLVQELRIPSLLEWKRPVSPP